MPSYLTTCISKYPFICFHNDRTSFPSFIVSVFGMVTYIFLNFPRRLNSFIPLLNGLSVLLCNCQVENPQAKTRTENQLSNFFSSMSFCGLSRLSVLFMKTFWYDQSLAELSGVMVFFFCFSYMYRKVCKRTHFLFNESSFLSRALENSEMQKFQDMNRHLFLSLVIFPRVIVIVVKPASGH